MRGSEGRKSPSRVKGQLPGGGPGTKPPEADEHFVKIMHEYFVYSGFRQHLQQKNTFQYFWGGGTCRPCPCLREPIPVAPMIDVRPGSDISPIPFLIFTGFKSAKFFQNLAFDGL